MTIPAVSVVIPCFNLGEYLDEAVESVLAQTFQDFEMVVVDDGSTDPSTVSLLEKFTRPRTRVIRTENHGLSAARNAGIAATTGRYLCMLDADDRLAPRYLERSVAALNADPGLAFVSHWLRTFGDEAGDWTPERCDFPSLLEMNTVNGAALVRREAVLAVGGFDEHMRHGCEDWDFWISLVERGYAGRIIPEVLFFYRRRSGSMSRAMLKNPGHLALYGHIIRKHADTFRVHLPSLIARRQRDVGLLERHIEDLQLDQYEWVESELEKRRDDVAMLTRRLERQRRERERERLEALTTELVQDKTRLEEQQAEISAALAQTREHLLRATSEALEHHARANRSEQEAAGLRNSASWRLTRPLRALVDAWYRASTWRR